MFVAATGQRGASHAAPQHKRSSFFPLQCENEGSAQSSAGVSRRVSSQPCPSLGEEARKPGWVEKVLQGLVHCSQIKGQADWNAGCSLGTELVRRPCYSHSFDFGSACSVSSRSKKALKGALPSSCRTKRGYSSQLRGGKECWRSAENLAGWRKFRVPTALRERTNVI